ncbi:MAG: phosphohistidine swiveling domain-containing protein, partial [Candidatus Woesearchaeota archaeon]
MNIVSFPHLNKFDVAKAGGKGASLGEMTQAGIAVPPGFVVITDAFEQFLDTHTIRKTVSDTLHSDKSALEKFELISKTIIAEAMPEKLTNHILTEFDSLHCEHVAVRSSATSEDSADAAWAGQLDSYLNVTRDNVVDSVKHCWASLFTERAIVYRTEKGLLNKDVSVAVVIQQMVNSETSGIAFSVHPVTENRDHIIIEAGFGLGEAIVSGQVTPDNYIISKSSKSIVETNVNEQTRGLFRAKPSGNEWRELSNGDTQVLTNEQISELSKMIQRVEDHYGFPVDVEWAFADNEFYIVQSRPITTLSKKEIMHKRFSREHTIFTFLTSWGIGSNNLADIAWSGMSISNLVGVNEGGKTTLWYFDEEYNGLFSCAIKKLQSDITFLDKVITEFNRCWNFLRPYLKSEKSFSSKSEFLEYCDLFERWWAPMAILFVTPYLNEVDEKARKRALHMRISYQEYVDAIDETFIKTISTLFPEYTSDAKYLTPQEVCDLFDGKQIGDISHRINGFVIHNNEVFSLEEGKQHIQESHISLEEEKTTVMTKYLSREHSVFYCDVWQKANQVDFGDHFEVVKNLVFLKEKEKVDVYYDFEELDKWKQILGNRINTDQKWFDSLLENYETRMGKLLGYIDSGIKKDHFEEFYQTWRSWWSYMGLLFVVPELEISSENKQLALDKRKRDEKYSDSCDTAFLESFRKEFTEHADLAPYILPEELFTLDTLTDNHLDDIKHRKTFAYVNGEMWPLHHLDHTLHELNLSLETQSGNQIKGTVACEGIVEGFVRLIRKKAYLDSFRKGEVLVTEMTSPDYVPVMKKAVAIVTDEGGVTCHAAIVSRELKVPCVIGTKNATQILKDGDFVEVDATKGTIKIIEPEVTTLVSIFSREKTLFYFTMWDDSDRIGFGDFLNKNIVHNLFHIKPESSRSHVYYSPK